MSKYPLIRTIYLYLFALVGLTLLVVGAVRFIDMGLKTFVFKQADRDRYIYDRMPPVGPFATEKIESIAKTEGKTTVEVTEVEKITMKNWLESYKAWENQQKDYDPLQSQRQRDASMNLALVIVGLPLYLYHWRLIKKDVKSNQG